MEVNSFRELVAQVIEKYNTFKQESTKAEEVLKQSAQEIANIKAEVLKANNALGETKESAEVVKNATKDLTKTREAVDRSLKQLEALKKEYKEISSSLQAFNDFTKSLTSYNLESIIKEALKVDSANILLFSKVVDELVLTNKYQELMQELSKKINDELQELLEAKGELGALKHGIKSAKDEVTRLLNRTKVESNYVLDETRKEALRLHYSLQELIGEEVQNAKSAINGYVADFYKVISSLQGKVLTLKVVVMDSLNNALKEYKENIEQYTQDHIARVQTQSQKVEEKFESIKASIEAMEKLNNAIVTGKKHKFRYNVFTALQYINTANVTLTRNDGILVNTIRFYNESYSKEVLDYLIAQRDAFNAEMAQKEAQAKRTLENITAINDDIELKRRAILFLSLKKG